MLYQKICSEYQRLKQEILAIQNQIRTLPEGKLICTHSGKYTKWYQSDGHHPVYIPKKNKTLAQQLAAKKYLQSKLAKLCQEQRALEAYLSQYANTCTPSEPSPSELLLYEESEFSELLSPYFTPDSKSLQEWMTEKYERNPLHPEQCIHKTSAGILVRSKSEALIATLLFTNKIPFRYECALTLGHTVIYPDFTIRHPKTGDLYYYEHFGMMDNPEYAKKSLQKTHLYVSHGIIPSIHLITSYETKENPLDSDLVETLLKHYFL